MKSDDDIDIRELIKLFGDDETLTDEQMDRNTAEAILADMGVNIRSFAPELKTKLEEEIETMRARNEEVPESFLKLLRSL